MTVRRTTRGVVATFAVAALALTACGSSKKSSAPSTGGSGTPSAGAAAHGGDGTLKLGTLLPETGSLAFLGPPEIAGVNLAVKDVNAAGGVLGKPVTVETGDSGDTSTNIASQTVDREIGDHVDAIIGAASSGVTLTVINKVVNSGTVMFSPANTSEKLTTFPDKGYYFRDAPPDNLQGQVLGDLVVGDGHQKVAIIARQDPYGTGLAADVKKEIESQNGTVFPPIFYDENAQTFDNEVDQLVADVKKGADTIVYITFDEGAKILTGAIQKGIGPQKVPGYFVDGNIGNALGDKLKSPGALGGMKGTQPGTNIAGSFKARLATVDPKLKDYNYSDSSYDAVVITALAAEAAKSDDPAKIKNTINDVTRQGTVCKTFKDCDALVKQGKDIWYQGILGDISFVDAGEPSKGSYQILKYGKGTNKIDDKATTYVEAGGK